MMVTINEMTLLDDHKIGFRFSDGTEKTVDFTPFIGTDKLTRELQSLEYFRQVKLYESGRGIYWPNEYDFCPDFLRRYEAGIDAVA